MNSHNIIKNFIVFEGIDKSGKSTQSKKLYDYYIKNKKKVFLENEPTDSEIGKIISKNLSKSKMNNYYLSLLFSADRWNHIYGENGILKISKSSILICDRYLFSSLAYQSLELDFDFIKSINNYPLPEYLIYLSIDIKAFEKRIKETQNIEVFEKKEILSKVINNYEKILEEYKNSGIKIIKIDANKQEKEIFLDIKNKLQLK